MARRERGTVLCSESRPSYTKILLTWQSLKSCTLTKNKHGEQLLWHSCVAKRVFVFDAFVENNKARINQFLNDLCEVGDFYETLEVRIFVGRINL